MKKLICIFLTLLAISGCNLLGEQPETTDSSTTEQKQGETTLTGKLVGTGDSAVLQQDNGDTTILESHSLNFDEYHNNEVQVTGEYSGTSLFVDEIITTRDE